MQHSRLAGMTCNGQHPLPGPACWAPPDTAQHPASTQSMGRAYRTLHSRNYRSPEGTDLQKQLWYCPAPFTFGKVSPESPIRWQLIKKSRLKMLPAGLWWQWQDTWNNCLISNLCLTAVNNLFLLCIMQTQSHVLFFRETFCSIEERDNKVTFVSL